MTIPKAMARFNKRVTNPVMRRVAARLPWCAVVTHTGRKSGRPYDTPVNLFRRGDDYVFVMTYGTDADWVRNVDAAGSCDLVTGGRRVRLVEPHHYTDPNRRDVPAIVRAVLRLIKVDEFMSMRAGSQNAQR